MHAPFVSLRALCKARREKSSGRSLVDPHDCSHSLCCVLSLLCACVLACCVDVRALCSKNNTKRMRGLLNAGVPASSCDYDRRTALHLACSEGHMEAAQMLVEEGADPNAKDRFGCTPLDDATRDGANHELVAYLRAKRAKHGGLDKLHAKLIENCAKGDFAAVRMLLAKDIDGLDVPGSAGIDPNWYATRARKQQS